MFTYLDVKRLEGTYALIMADDLTDHDIVRIISADMYPDILIEDETGFRGLIPVEWLTTI